MNMLWHWSLTVPTPLVLALKAENIVTPCISLDRYITARAFLAFEFRSPVFKGISLSLPASLPLVPRMARTLKAEVSFTLTTLNFFG